MSSVLQLQLLRALRHTSLPLLIGLLPHCVASSQEQPTPCPVCCPSQEAEVSQEYPREGGGVYEQRRVDLAIFRALPASTWGHCSQVLCFTIVWDTPEKEKIAKWSPAPASILEGFNEIYVVYGPPKPYKTREKRQSCQIDPCLPPYREYPREGGGVRGSVSRGVPGKPFEKVSRTLDSFPEGLRHTN